MSPRFLDLSAAVKLRFSGPDALRYLNGQVSNDVRKLQPAQTIAACVTNHKGRLEALVHITIDPAGAFYLTSDPALRDFLPARMEKYLIADDALAADISDAWSLLHFLDTPPDHPAGAWMAACDRFGQPGWDVWILKESAAAQSLRNSGQEISPADVEPDRIERGIPAWGRELTSDVLPPEAGLDTFAIDYHKGCYIGQEIISRLRSVGQVNRRLVRLDVRGKHIPAPGWPLFSTDEGGKRQLAGTITSAAWHPARNRTFALGYVRKNFFSQNAQFSCGPDENLLPCVVAIRIP